jgi:hypothetical protein
VQWREVVCSGSAGFSYTRLCQQDNVAGEMGVGPAIDPKTEQDFCRVSCRDGDRGLKNLTRPGQLLLRCDVFSAFPWLSASVIKGPHARQKLLLLGETVPVHDLPDLSFH